MIEIKSFFSDWREVDRETALICYHAFCEGAIALDREGKRNFYNEKRIRGAYITEHDEIMEVQQ